VRLRCHAMELRTAFSSGREASGYAVTPWSSVRPAPHQQRTRSVRLLHGGKEMLAMAHQLGVVTGRREPALRPRTGPGVWSFAIWAGEASERRAASRTSAT